MRLQRIIVGGAVAVGAALAVTAGPAADASVAGTAGTAATVGTARTVAAKPTPPSNHLPGMKPMNTANGCGYPQVCFYLTAADWNARKWTAAYKDVTSSPQNLSSRAYGAYSAFNSRNDDGALLYYTNGGTYCLRPNQPVFNNSWVVNRIRIMDDPNCGL
jgi:hypothetical protein